MTGRRPWVVLVLALGSLGSAHPALSAQSKPTLAERATPNVHFIAHWLDYAGHYQLEIQNYSRLGTVTGFAWKPPSQLVISSIESVQGGACRIEADGSVFCRSSLGPSGCDGDTCYSGGDIVVTFTAKLNPAVQGASFADLFWGSSLNVTSITPVPQGFADLPLCRPGQRSTNPKPCSPR